MSLILSPEQGKQLPRYNFMNPERVSSKLMLQLRESLVNLGQVFAEHFSAKLNTTCEVRIRDAAESPSTRMFESPLDLVYALPPVVASGQILVRFDSALGQMLVERLLGGPGVPRTVERGPTRIEVGLVALVARSLLAGLMLGEDPASVEDGHEPEFVPMRNQGKFASALGITTDFDLAAKEQSGVFQLFTTYADLSRITGLEFAPSPQTDEATTENQKFTTDHLGEMKLRLRAVLSAAPVPINEVARLQVGDVLRLERKLTDEVEIRIDDRLAFLGHPGTVWDSVGVQISKAL